jgi:hypothetical protein
MRSIVLTMVGAGALAAGVALANPGDPFGGDDTGCVPSTKDQLRCEGKLTKVTAKLIAGAIRCHLAQAEAAFRGSTFAESSCEQSARAKYDRDLGRLAAGGTCPQQVLDNAGLQETLLLAGQGQTSPPSLDALNGTIFCDPTSGVPLAGAAGDPDVDDAGSVPATPENLKCAVGVAKNISKLWSDIMTRCHSRAATLGFGGSYADDEACEDGAFVGVRTRYERSAEKLAAAGICPPCLDGPSQTVLGDAIETRADQDNGLIFVCPAP